MHLYRDVFSFKIENFQLKIIDFQLKIIDIFLIFAQKHRLWVHVRTAAVLTSTHNPCFQQKIKKIGLVYVCKPQFFYIKVGFEGVYISWICFPDVQVPEQLRGMG